MTTKDLWILLALTGLLAGCGQKGPLVLPDAQHPHKKLKFPASSGATQPAPAAPAETPGNPPGTAAARRETSPKPSAPAGPTQQPTASPDAPSADHSTTNQAPQP